MADLIDREKLIEQLRGKIQDNPITNVWNSAINCAYKIIKAQPPADTERHAHWIDINEVSAKCSNCEEFILRCDTNNYCPVCGCKMDEVAANENVKA